MCTLAKQLACCSLAKCIVVAGSVVAGKLEAALWRVVLRYEACRRVGCWQADFAASKEMAVAHMEARRSAAGDTPKSRIAVSADVKTWKEDCRPA